MSLGSTPPSSAFTTMEPLYGQKDLAEFCEFVIANLFEVAPSSSHQQDGQRQGIDTPPYTPPPESETSTSTAAQRKEPPALVEFIAYALYRTRLPISIVHQSLLLLSRLKQRYPSARGTSSSPHRLFLSSLMLSAKISMDDTYSNKSWAIVGSSYFPLREVNQMERELFAFLGWNVVVQKDELDSFIASAEASYAAAQASKKAERAKRRRLEEDEARDSRHRQATNAARALLRPHTYRHQTSPSPTRSSYPSASSSSSGVYTPASMASSPAMQASPVASTSAHAASPPYPSSSHQHYDFLASAMQARTPYTPSSSSSISSSAVSSAFPSATHSPTSPASEPFSAGPQTPDSEFNYLHHHHHSHHPQSAAQQHYYNQQKQHATQHYHQHEISSDFPEADSYMKTKARSVSPPNRKLFRPHVSSPSFMHPFSSQQVQA